MSWKNYTKSQIITMNAVLCAMVIIFVFVPRIGVLQTAVIPIIAIIISAEVMGVYNGMLTGLFFGLISLLNHFVKPGILSFAFYNPLVSIVPRVLIGVSSYFAAKGVFALFKNKADNAAVKVAAYGAGGLCGVLTNTVGVLSMILAFHFGTTLSNGSALNWKWLAGIIVSNSILEAVVCTVLSPPLVLAVKKVCEKTARGKNTRSVPAKSEIEEIKVEEETDPEEK